jgi:Protein of unknown function (DUF1566)
MKPLMKTMITLTVLLVSVPLAEAIDIISAEVQNGVAVVQGNKAAKQATIVWETGNVGQTTKGGSFSFTGIVPADCVGQLSIGTDAINVALANCASPLLATGQTTPVPANKDDGIVQPVPVDDDGTLKLGTPLRYRDNGDGTVTDLNTGLMWEKKVEGAGCLHCVNDEFYRWSIGIEDGSQKSIWDWLDDLNASNFAGHSDWRIPNLRELLSIVHYGFVSPALDPVFGPSAVAYWSSTTAARGNFNDAAYVDFNLGEVRFEFNVSGNAVRAVR